MAIPSVYRRSGQPNLVTYDYADISDGTGNVTFYGSLDQSSQALLTRSTPYSNLIQSGYALTTTSTWEQCLDVDFDVTINKTLLVDGTTYVNVPIAGAGAAGTILVQAWIYLRKYDGTTETTLAQASSAVINKTSPSTMTLTQFDTPLTVFKKGEKLRLTVQVWANKSVGAGTVYLAHDPKNRASGVGFGASDPTVLTLGLPVSLQL